MKRSWDSRRSCIFSIKFSSYVFPFILWLTLSIVCWFDCCRRRIYFLLYNSPWHSLSIYICDGSREKNLDHSGTHDRAQSKDKKIIKRKTQNHNCLYRANWKGGIRVLTSKETKTSGSGKMLSTKLSAHLACVGETDEEQQEKWKICACQFNMFTFSLRSYTHTHTRTPYCL